ncbi:antibiotic biosynthesis monooxygenase [Pseudomonas sp. NPDC089554]|uniref:antibiotic biosynthesis monooxygenase n=1 Tax=Pseudomonas sp. NPDC089554 TaxID=3390653 RepID=UPI003D02C16F
MTIQFVNTIKIKLPERFSDAFAQSAQAYVLRLQQSSGCHDYVLVQSTQDRCLWWLSGYWENQQLMERSFEGAAMAELLDQLILHGASLSFGMFAHGMAKPHGH